MVSLTDSDGEGQTDIPDSDIYSGIDNRISVQKAIATLPENDKKLIYLRYFAELTQSKTAQELGISQVQVSRREKIILNQLRNKLTG